VHCETVRRGSGLPASRAVEARDWSSLDRDEPSTDVSIVAPWAQANRFRTDRPLTEHAPDGTRPGFTRETETATTCALLQVHALTIRNAFRSISSYVLARRWFPSHRRRTLDSFR